MTSLSDRFQGAAAVREAAAAIRGEAVDNARAFAAERDIVQAWAEEHTELGTEAEWQGVPNPADVVRCVERAELPGGPYFGGLVFTFADVRAVISAVQPDVVQSPIELRDWIVATARTHAGRTPPTVLAGRTRGETVAAFLAENVASAQIYASFGAIVQTVAQVDDAIANAQIPVAQGANVAERVQALSAWCRHRVPTTAHAQGATLAEAVQTLAAITFTALPTTAECFGAQLPPEGLVTVARVLGTDVTVPPPLPPQSAPRSPAGVPRRSQLWQPSATQRVAWTPEACGHGGEGEGRQRSGQEVTREEVTASQTSAGHRPWERDELPRPPTRLFPSYRRVLSTYV